MLPIAADFDDKFLTQ